MLPVTNTVVGRDAELAAVERFLDVLPEGPRALLIEGEAGIGKTTVWREAVAAAERRGYRVLQAQPAESEAQLSYSALADLLGEAFDEIRPELPEPQRRALDVALLRAGGSEAEPRTIATALLSVVSAVATDGPLVVAVDDVQWLDRASERALEFLARRLPAGVWLLLTRRSVGNPGAPLGLDRARPGVRVDRLKPRPLTLAALHHLIRIRLGVTLVRPTLVRLEQASGGNPFLALEIARALDDWTPSLGESLPIPADVREVSARRIARLPQPTRAALLLAAALTRPTTAIVAEADLAPAEEAGVVRIEGGRIEFTHPLLASAVYAAASTSARRAAHSALAEQVGDLEERARHMSLAASGPDEGVAQLLDAAAARARSRGAPDEAGELQERAAQLTPATHSTAAHRRTAAAAEHFSHAGDPQRAHALLDLILPEVSDRSVRGECLRLLGELRYTENSFPAAIELLDEALRHVDAPEVAIPIRLDLAFAHLSVQNKQVAVAEARRAVALAEDFGHAALLGEALAFDAIIGYLCGAGIDREKIGRALALEDEQRRIRLMARPSSVAAMLAVSDGRLSEAVERLHAVCDGARARGEESELPLLLAYLASAEWRRANYDAAARAADAIIHIAAQTGNEPARAIGITHRAMAATFRGDAVAARADLEAAAELMERTGWALGASYVRMGRGFLELSIGDAAAADDILLPLTHEVESGDWSDPELALFVPDAIEACISLGSLERAARLLDVLERGADANGTAWAGAESLRCRGLYLAATGDLAGALRAAEEASVRAATLEMPFVLARTLLLQGQVQRRLKRKRLAKESLEQALAIFEEFGTPLWSARAREELARVGQRPAAADDLTASERRIAELAASGMTNREIAQAAFVSPKTVEANLARAYRKLGIRSRAELGARMARVEQT